MKNVFALPCMVLILCFSQPGLMAQRVAPRQAFQAASEYLLSRSPGLCPAAVSPLLSNRDTLAWLIRCEPLGFLLASADHSQPPVLAWSEEGNFGEGEAWDDFLPLLMHDLKTRTDFLNHNSPESLKNRQKWSSLLNPDEAIPGFQQWPPEGWSSTGGWLFTNWTQTAPYNAFCPVDGQTQVRSVAGCPATAMAQIVNFHHKLNGTRFDDTDDYYHNFGSGNMYWIDNDWESHGFPSWSDLNTLLDTLDAHYQNQLPLTNPDKAALTYACGVAARQVYSSSVSGTYGINQAYDAFIRFGYSDAQLIYPSNPGLTSMLSDNIKLALPAQLGLVNPEGTAGHNVVVDGYNTDELFHFNFGWGGSANGWYTMPPTDIPYNLTVIEGIVLDINLSNPPVAIGEEPASGAGPQWRYNPDENTLTVRWSERSENARICVYDISGRLCSRAAMNGGYGKAGLPSGKGCGLHLGVLITSGGSSYTHKFIR